MGPAEVVDPLLGRVVQLQWLPQAEQVILRPAPAQLCGNVLLALEPVPVPQFRQRTGLRVHGESITKANGEGFFDGLRARTPVEGLRAQRAPLAPMPC
jgi:hypothetical protein